MHEGTSEIFFVNLSNPINATIIDNQGVGTITDDDEPPILSINNEITVIEGNTGSNNANITVNLNKASGVTIRVDYTTVDNTATSEDYQAIAATLTLNPGQTEATFPIKIYGDFLDEDNEQFFVNLTNPINTILATNQTIVTIIDDDLLDIDGPEITNIQFNSQALVEAITITDSGTISLNATDNARISRIEFLIDNNLFHTDSNGSNQYSAFWSIQNISDGNHTISIKAYDTLENVSTTNINVLIALAPPAAPIITQPLSGITTNQAQITVTGTAEKNSEVFLYRNGTQIGQALTLNHNNAFSATRNIESGENNLTAAASNRGGIGELSNSVLVTLDTTIPDAPTGFAAEAKESGQVRLSWQAASSFSYDIYRATSSFETIQQAQKINRLVRK